MRSAVFQAIRAARGVSWLRAARRIPLAWRIYNVLYERFKPQERVLVQTVPGFKLYVDPDRDAALAPFLLMDGAYEPGVTMLFERTIKKGMVVVDVGANIGYHTLLAARLVGETGLVYAFEPDLRNFNRLRENVELNHERNALLVNKAVLGAAGRASLLVSRENAALHRVSTTIDRQASIEVDATSLDEFLGSARVDFVKADVQGAEMSVLTGMRGILRRNPNLVMLTEFWPQGLREFGVEPERFLAELVDLGFDLLTVGHESGEIIGHESGEIMNLCGDVGYVDLFCRRRK